MNIITLVKSWIWKQKPSKKPQVVPPPVPVKEKVAALPKPKPQKLKRCLQVDKVMFTREQAQESCTKRSTKLKPLRIYVCEFCSTWHLTHHKRYKY